MKDSVGWFSLLSWHSHKMHQNATRTVAPLLGRSKSNVQVEQVQTEKQLYMAKYGNWTNRTNWKPGYEYESGGHDTPIVLRVHFFITEIALLVFVTIFSVLSSLAPWSVKFFHDWRATMETTNDTTWVYSQTNAPNSTTACEWSYQISYRRCLNMFIWQVTNPPFPEGTYPQ